MYKRILRFVQSVQDFERRLDRVDERQQQMLVNQGVIISAYNASKEISSLYEVEFKIFSQWGEDGIIQYLAQNIEIPSKTFIEFGVEDFSESNCRFLMMKDNWSGFVIDGAETNVRRIQASPNFWRYDLTAHCAFITKDNIAKLLEQSGFGKDVGILSIDVDGMDYWVAQALSDWRPRIFIIEYNAVFGIDRAVVVPYDAKFNRTAAHPSNLYWGAGLKALYLLAKERGYELVGTNSGGNNAFFVRRELLNGHVKAVELQDAYTESKFRESRDQAGKLTFIAREERLRAIKGMPVFNVETGEIQTL